MHPVFSLSNMSARCKASEIVISSAGGGGAVGGGDVGCDVWLVAWLRLAGVEGLPVCMRLAAMTSAVSSDDVDSMEPRRGLNMENVCLRLSAAEIVSSWNSGGERKDVGEVKSMPVVRGSRSWR